MAEGSLGHQATGEVTSALRLRRGPLRRRTLPVAAVGHELVELGAVLGKAQALEELAKLALLLFKPLQGLLLVFVEGAIAARRCRAPPAATALSAAAVFAAALHAAAIEVHLLLQSRHLMFEPAVAVHSTSH